MARAQCHVASGLQPECDGVLRAADGIDAGAMAVGRRTGTTGSGPLRVVGLSEL